MILVTKCLPRATSTYAALLEGAAYNYQEFHMLQMVPSQRLRGPSSTNGLHVTPLRPTQNLMLASRMLNVLTWRGWGMGVMEGGLGMLLDS